MKSLLFSIIIGIICITCLIILFVKMKNMNENLNKHITTDLKELPAEITLDKLKVKDLEVDDKLSTSIIYNKNNDLPITVSSPIAITKDISIQNDNLDIHSNKVFLNNDDIKVNPNLKLTTEFDKDKAAKHQNPTSLVNINDDNSNINMEFKLNDVVYTLYNSMNRRNQGGNKEKVSKENIEQTRDVNIDNDDDFIYDNNGHRIGILKEELLKKSCLNGSVYDVDGRLRETTRELLASSCNFKINSLYLEGNDIIHISQQLYDHLQNGIKTMDKGEAISNIMYPSVLIHKIINNEYVINTNKQDKTNAKSIETFIDIPSYNYYVYE